MAHDSEGSDQLVVGIIGPGAVGCALVRRLFPIVSQLGMIGRQGPIAYDFMVHKKSLLRPTGCQL